LPQQQDEAQHGERAENPVQHRLFVRGVPGPGKPNRSRRREEADSGMVAERFRLLTSAHMKSEVKTDFPRSESQSGLLLTSQDDRSKVRAACVCAVFLGWAGRQPSPRIHSTVRFGERSQAHMGDSGLLSSCLRSCFAFFLSAWLARSKVIGELSGQGTSQLRGLALPCIQAERLGLSWPPGSAAATGGLPARRRPHRASRT
jgi:hypothetical protein